MKHRNSILTTIVLLNSFFLKAQTKDSVIFSDYYILANSPLSRNSAMDIGIERIKKIKNNWYYASQLSATVGKFNGNVFNKSSSASIPPNPYFFSICLQPFHLLYGKNLKIETGLSTSFQTFGSQNKGFLVKDTSRYYPLYHDALYVFYTFGLRYTFKKPQISIKLILGLRCAINLQKNESYFVDAGGGEFGINWRFRKKIKRKAN